MSKSLYFYVLDFVFFCKKLEFTIKNKYVPESSETLMREHGQKNIPKNGEFIYEGSSYAFHIHGIGITYTVGDKYFTHTFHLGKGLGICFNIWEVMRYHEIEFDESCLEDVKNLFEKGYLGKVYEASEVYYLK